MWLPASFRDISCLFCVFFQTALQGFVGRKRSLKKNTHFLVQLVSGRAAETVLEGFFFKCNSIVLAWEKEHAFQLREPHMCEICLDVCSCAQQGGRGSWQLCYWPLSAGGSLSPLANTSLLPRHQVVFGELQVSSLRTAETLSLLDETAELRSCSAP